MKNDFDKLSEEPADSTQTLYDKQFVNLYGKNLYHLEDISQSLKKVLGKIDEEIKSHEEHYPKLSVYARAKHRHTIIILKKLLKKVIAEFGEGFLK